MIDPAALPASAAFDSSTLVPALRGPMATDDPASAKMFDAMVASGLSVLIPAPVAAEIFRRSPTTAIPRVRAVRVVAFDHAAAEVLGRSFPPEVLTAFRGASKKPLHYFKYDAMIVACAVRHRAAVLVSTDDDQRRLAQRAGLAVARPSDYLSKQIVIAGT